MALVARPGGLDHSGGCEGCQDVADVPFGESCFVSDPGGVKWSVCVSEATRPAGRGNLPVRFRSRVPGSVVVVDTGNYHPELRDGRIHAIDRDMLDNEWVAQQLGRPVIKAFNNILAASLLEKGVLRGMTGRIALPAAKATVLRLVDDLGFDPVDGGELDDSWRQQPGTPAYLRDLGAAALRRALAEADRSRIAAYRVEEEARIRRSIAAETASGSAPR